MSPDHGPSGPRGGPFRFRDSLGEKDEVGSELLVEGSHTGRPLVTIGITTYRRTDFLIEAVRSALDQQFDRPFEILVVDDDPSSVSADALARALPEVKTRAFRYYRHQENLGIYHNFNRIVRYSRGEWLTILNDDDLLDSNYLQLMFAELDKNPQIDGLTCQRRILDQRDGLIPDQGKPGQFLTRRINVAHALSMLRSVGSRRRFVKAAVDRIIFEAMFYKGLTRPIPAHKFFWGSILGTGCGFIYRRKCALEIGGFYQDETPSSDYWFYVRFAKLNHLRQHRGMAATTRIAENETARRSNVLLSFRNAYAIQRALAHEDVPAWWLRLSPLVLAWHRTYFRDDWRIELTEAEIAEATQVQVGRDRPKLLFALRLMLRGL